MKIKYEFEKIISCIDNYCFKLNNRTFDILQDKMINVLCCDNIRLFESVADVLKKTNNYNSFTIDVERMSKRYNYFNKISTFDLENADVSSKERFIK